ncbi:MAG: alpha/beta hydrolase, partial [Aequorivita sp.]|nr:alpha/beta hydrolase [Aequorivita sp.]
IKAEEDPRINKMAIWASVSDFKARFKENTPEFSLWKEKGVTYVENSRTKQMLPQRFQLYKNFKENEERLTIKRAVMNLKIPLLIVHGSDDPTVSLNEAQTIHLWNPQSNLEIIDKADHVFNAKHPWEEATLPNQLKTAVERTIEFFK